jgi:hypothetical protein
MAIAAFLTDGGRPVTVSTAAIFEALTVDELIV